MPITPFDHLILLIGTNSVPNYVSACYLLTAAYENNRAPSVHLIYTEETAPIAERLIGILIAHFDQKGYHDKLLLEKTVFLHELVDAYIPAEVERDMKDAMEGLNGHVHLHHTGGTKSMAVESALVASRLFKNGLTRSYLNPRTYTLGISDSRYPTEGNLTQIIRMSLADLAALHDCKLLSTQQHNWIESGKAMLNLVLSLNGKDLKTYLEWKKEFVAATRTDNSSSKEQFINDCGRWAMDAKSLITWPTVPGFDLVLSALDKDAPYIVKKSPAQWSKSVNEMQLRASVFVHFIKGGWLEDCVCGVARDSGKWHELESNCEIQKTASKKQMELDVLALQGYCLTLFSCTASNSGKEIKLKCFEAIHRVRQLGGDEAQAVMVCLMHANELKQMYEDLHSDYGSRPPIKFISKQGLNQLEASLRGIADNRLGQDNKEITIF